MTFAEEMLEEYFENFCPILNANCYIEDNNKCNECKINLDYIKYIDELKEDKNERD